MKVLNPLTTVCDVYSYVKERLISLVYHQQEIVFDFLRLSFVEEMWASAMTFAFAEIPVYCQME